MSRTCRQCQQDLPENRFQEVRRGDHVWRRRVCKTCIWHNQKNRVPPGGKPGRGRNGEDVFAATAVGRTCTRCGMWKPKEHFSLVKRTGNLFSQCSDCVRESNRQQWYRERDDPGKRKARYESVARSNEKLRKDVLNAYGNKCACCGEQEPLFLTLDHANNDGAQHRRGEGIYTGTRSTWAWARQNNYPETLQLLCYNCNCAKGNHGYCPHQRSGDPGNNQLAAKDYVRRA